MPRSNAPESPHNGDLETSWNTLFERSKPVLQEAPARLDGTEFGRVGRQEEQSGLRAFDQTANFGRVMGTKVVEHDDISGIEARNEPVTNEVDEPRPVDGTVERLVGQNAVGAHSSDDADVFAPVGGPMIDNTLTTRCSAIRGRHRDVAARLVDEDQPVRRDAFDLFEEGGALLLDVVAELLRRPETLFFRVTPARCSERSTLDRLRSTPYRVRQVSLSWSSVASGMSATSRTRSGNCSSEILGGKPPPATSGTTCPNSRWRRSSRETVASPTPNLCANSKYVPSSRSYAATIRRLRSNDKEFTARYRSDSLDLFKREAV